ncbi:MAG: carboxypeptidase-like regulatory domain-containing protein, partial [Chitinophagaceae bacterium]|nr:carboxypeptidase-like regulatory domain-containing protein [Chitinophagaceae bacterium]
MKLPFTILFTIIILSITTKVNSQTLKGKVLNESGFAAANVTIHFSNKHNSITTNKDGSFIIKATRLPDTLVFTAVGLEPYKVVITEKNIADPDFSVVLLNKRLELSEVVVGYESKKKKSAMKYPTGEASKLAEKKASSKHKVSDMGEFEEALMGSVSGIEISGSASLTSSSMHAPILVTKGYSAPSKKVIFTDSVTIKEGRNYATRLLTAGEINDFAKWKMWDDFTDNEFKEYAKTWGVNMKQRYCVELQNTSSYAVVNHSVYLLNKYTNDTIWRAKTDNTGKAELWANTDAETKNIEYIIAIEGYDRITNPYLFSEGINRVTINTNCNNNNTIEIAFVVDATGSMGDEIEYLKLELEDVMNKTFTHYNSLDVKAASVFYKDHGDDYVTKFVPLNNDLLKTLNFIKLQKASGGGDMPEAVDAALATALEKLAWTNEARTKILFLILDAPPHYAAKEKMIELIQK